jgi:hypothetical protein
VKAQRYRVIHGDSYGNGYGNGDGYGYGNGYGDGDGDGYGVGYGYGYGDGNGDGVGYGYGYGYGDGNGDGYGWGPQNRAGDAVCAAVVYGDLPAWAQELLPVNNVNPRHFAREIRNNEAVAHSVVMLGGVEELVQWIFASSLE